MNTDIGKLFTAFVLGPRNPLFTLLNVSHLMVKYPVFGADAALAIRSASLCSLHSQLCMSFAKFVHADRTDIHTYLKSLMMKYCTWCCKEMSMIQWQKGD